MSSGTVAAFLTILGYSLYDTIIVFDRIRENMPRMPRAAFSQIVNRSMSEVLTRSLATSFSTLLAVGSLLVFGGATLQDFAFAMLVGIASGTYSSIFIASPVLTAWKEREPGFARRRARIAEVEGRVPAFADEIELAKLGEEEGDEQIAAGLEAKEEPKASAVATVERPGDSERVSPSANGEPPPAAAADPVAAERRERDERRRARRQAAPQAWEESLADGAARMVHDGNRPLALHGVPARSLLAGHSRRLPRLGNRCDRLRRDRRVPRQDGASATPTC